MQKQVKNNKVSVKDSLKTLVLKKRIPGQLVIQMTDKCNAICPQCGMRVTEKFRRSVLPADQIRTIIDSAAQKKVQAISFTGGEPMLFLDTLADLICHAGKAGIPYIRTGTNGFFFAGSHKPGFEKKINRIAQILARTPLRNFWISIDSSLPGLHESMRGFPGIIAGIERALPIFHEHGIWPSVNLGINRNLSQKTVNAGQIENHDEKYLTDFYLSFREGFKRFYRFVIDLGFTIVNSCYPMSAEDTLLNPDSLSPVYAASSKNSVVRFSPFEKSLIFKSLFETIPEFRSKIRIFSPRTSLYALMGQHLNCNEMQTYPCRGGLDFFYISAENGDTYPCGYRGYDNLGKFKDLNLNGSAKNSQCRQCDWECFRDPSELFGPLLQGVSMPLDLIKKIREDPLYFSLWMADLRYYRACNLFDGRKCPDSKAIAKF